MITFLQATFEGLSLGAVYSLVAIGFVLIYKATDVLSFAQPALVVVGAGLISALAVDRGVPFWIAFIVGILLTGIIGLVMERTFLRPMVGEPVFSVAILTIGIDILLRTVLNNWIGLNPRYLGDPFQSFGNFGSVNVGGVTLKYLEIAALFTGVVLIILLSVFFKRSKYIPEDFEEDLSSVIDKYKERGYRDARIISDSIYDENKAELANINMHL